MAGQMGHIEYTSNNSGGHWWLDDAQWKALEAAGWAVRWVKDEPQMMKDEGGERWLGALAREASKDDVSSMTAGVRDWEKVTGACSTDVGCACCGIPHNFVFEGADGEREYGPNVSYEASW